MPSQTRRERRPAQGAANNFFTLGTAGGNNDQYTFRADQTLSSKQSVFERYTHWHSMNIDPQPYGNNLYVTALAPEVFTTQQLVVGDTYVFNPTSIVDVHLSYLRWNYNRIPTNLGLDESKAFGWPSYMNFGYLNNLPKSTAVPTINTVRWIHQLYPGWRRIHLLHQQQLCHRFHLPEGHRPPHVKDRYRLAPAGDVVFPEQQPRRYLHL